jgi:hypothetical protein
MRALHPPGRQLAEVFSAQRLEQIESTEPLRTAANELRVAALDWIEHHTERKLKTRKLLETT